MLKNFVKPTSVDICTEEVSLWPLEPLFTTPPLSLALLDSLVLGRPLGPPTPGEEPLAPHPGTNPADSVV